jgi:hypothetical protein
MSSSRRPDADILWLLLVSTFCAFSAGNAARTLAGFMQNMQSKAYPAVWLFHLPGFRYQAVVLFSTNICVHGSCSGFPWPRPHHTTFILLPISGMVIPYRGYTPQSRDYGKAMIEMNEFYERRLLALANEEATHKRPKASRKSTAIPSETHSQRVSLHILPHFMA